MRKKLSSMDKNGKSPYIFLVGIIKIVITVYSGYLLGIIIFNSFLNETYGEVTNIHAYEETYIQPYRSRTSKHDFRDIYYQYTINGEKYIGKRISNLLIFPDLYNWKNKKIIVYYNNLFPKYSILFKGNPEYIFYNSIPVIILFIISYFIKKKYNLQNSNPKDDNEPIELETVQDEFENDGDEEHEMGKYFFQELENGEKEFKFLLLLSENDGMTIEALLKSEEIPYTIEYTSEKLRSYKNCVFYILEKNYTEAIFVLNDFIKNKKEKEKNNIIIFKNSN
jgi:hypothetical protein